MKRKSKKKVFAVLMCAVLAATGIVGTTFAILHKSSEPAQNKFKGSAVNIGVLEDGKILEDGDNQKTYPKMTSDGVAKSVKIKNIDSEEYPTADTYVRVRLVPIFRDANGATIAADMSKVLYTYGENTDGNWLVKDVGGSDYYYYKKALAPDEETTELIIKVAYTGEIPDGATFELRVLTEGVAAGQKDSLTAWGLPLQNPFAGLTPVANV